MGSSGWTRTRLPARKTTTTRKRRSKVLLDRFYKRWLQPLVVELEACLVVCLVACLLARAGCLVECLVVSQQEACLVDLVVLPLLVARPQLLVLIWMMMVQTSRKSTN